jgi:predicted nucleic acid-binding protein
MERFLTWNGQIIISTSVLDEVYSYFVRRGVGSNTAAARNFVGLIQPLFKEVVRVEAGDLDRALDINEQFGIGYRRSVHTAVSFNRGIYRIFSEDRDFDRVPGLRRVKSDDFFSSGT